MPTFASEETLMGKLDGRLAKLEATVGQADENRHWQAMLALQPKLHEMYWQSRREGWPVHEIP